MFDTLFSTNSFDPKAFCQFLVRLGDRAIAEQIGIACIEKSYGKAALVQSVLDDLVPQSEEANELAGGAMAEGKKVYLQWRSEQGNRKRSFEAALKVQKEEERLQKVLPFVDNIQERREQLKQACP
jgi:hypothetical protein